MSNILFSGTSNLPLAQKIAVKLNIKLGDLQINRFIDNECRVWVKEKIFASDDIFVLQSLSSVADQNLVELCLIGQALKTLKADKVTAIIPWLGYSKQDKEFRKGEAVSAQLVAKFIEAAGFDNIISLELHSENLLPFFKIPFQKISTHDLLAQQIQINKNMLVISPDKGGQGRSQNFAKKLNLPIAYVEKQRDLITGIVKVVSVSENVKGKEIIFFDDIINTGQTAIKESEYLKDKGVKKIIFLATHAVLAGDASPKLQNSPIDEIIVTDTIKIPKEKQFPKLKIISVVDLIANKII